MDDSSHADKGVQTDSTTCSRDSSPVRTFHAFPQINSPSDLQALDVSQSSGLSSALRSLGHLGAYTYSDASLDDSRYISDRPVLNSGRTAKYGQLGYNKPRHGLPTNHRIASLPETSPPYRIAQENTVRLVSMPEHLQMLHRSGALSVEYLDYSECMNISSASDSKSNFINSPANCTLLAPVPRTPSPPSSPESVMIIGNDNHVPPAFLRPKSSIDDDDHGGWIPWKGSPPKPIPALHGPLSLPYARCPSGAEGIVVEGEDLTHMIWGLDSNGLSPGQTKSHSVGIHGHKTPRPVFSSQLPKPTSYQDHAMRNQDVIDLSRPGFHTSLARSHVVAPQPQQSSWACPSSLDRLSKGAHHGRTNGYEFVRRDSPIQLYPTSLGLLQSDANPWNAGLGINLWQGAHENGTFSLFEPALSLADSRESPSVLGRPVEPISTTHISSTPRSLSVYEAQALGSYGQRSGLPTPPDTGSPRWSPRLRQLHLASASPDLQYEQNRRYIDLPQPGIRESLISDKGQEQLLLSMVPEYRSIVDLVRGSEIPRAPIVYGTPDAGSAHGSESESLNVVIQPLPKPRPMQGRPNTTNGRTPPSPVSPDVRRNLSQQQPRSIPLARLIQRRLSSVVEEELEIESTTSSAPNGCPVKSSPTISIATSKVDIWRENERGGSQDQGLKVDISSSMTAGPSDNTKRTYRPPAHPSRRISSNARNVTTKIQKSVAMDEATVPTNRFGKNKENNAGIQQPGTKPKKSYRKKFIKKQGIPVTVNK